MSVLLVRHGSALSRQQWREDDALRPLDERGLAQARALVEHLAGHRVETVASSPAVRCTQTVAPLAEARGLRVVEDPALAEGASLVAFRQVVDDLDHAVLCSHGDLIPDLIDQLIGEGVDAVGRDCKKGSTWVLERDGAGFSRATYVPPPPVA